MKNEGSNNASGFGVFSKIKLIATSLIVGLALGATGILLFNAHNVDEESQDLEASAVFERIIQQNTMITASQRYQIVDKVSDENEILGSIKVPFTENSFWYRFAGTIQAGVDLDKAAFDSDGKNITVTLPLPYIVSNTPDREKMGILEEHNNILNPIHVEDVDAFQKKCIEMSRKEAIDDGLLKEARVNAEKNVTGMFVAALGDEYTVSFNWQENPKNAS